MTVDTFISWLLAKKGKAAMASAVLALTVERCPQLPHGSKKEFERELRRHVDVLSGHLAEGRRREALATTLALVVADAEATIRQIRKYGLFRSSRYAFQGSLIGDIVKLVLQVQSRLSLDPAQFIYLESVQALVQLSPSVRKVHNELTSFLAERKDEVVKTILVAVNNIFFHGWLNDRGVDTEDPSHYSGEELSEAASTLLSMYREMYPLRNVSMILGQVPFRV